MRSAKQEIEPRRTIPIGRAIVTLFAIALVVSAAAATQGWLDQHFLPSFFLPRRWYVAIETFVRVVLATTGVLLLARSNRAGRLRSTGPARLFSVVLAVVLALTTSELVLRTIALRPVEWLVPDEEPRRQPDARLGWTLVPSRTGHRRTGGRSIDYTFDATGYRVAGPDTPVDVSRPTVVFTGESVMFGEGLTWEETIPAQVAATLGVQSANMAVHGYSNDQAYLRLQTELPRFRRPVAVVSLFMTALFGRNLDSDRPRLGPGLEWLPAAPRGRLAALAALVVPFRRTQTVERGISVTRDVFRATAALAEAHGAAALIVVPQFGPESSIDQMLRRRTLDEAGVPYVRIELDSAWRLPWDRHPNAYAAHLVAAAIAQRLRAAAVN